MAKKKVFVSFDFDNDKVLKDFIIGQANNSDSPFEVSDYSLKEAAPEKDWLDRAERAIGRSDVFVIINDQHVELFFAHFTLPYQRLTARK